MVDFKSLKDLDDCLRNSIFEAIDDDVAREVKRTQSNMVFKTVYVSYPRPTEYERRGINGGLADIGNMEHEVNNTKDGIILSVSNKTTSNPDYLPKNKSSFEIAGVVEFGHGYNGDIYDYPTDSRFTKARGFIQETRKELATAKSHVQALKDGLLKRGIKTV